MRSKRQNRGIISIWILAAVSFLIFIVISFATRITYETKMVFSTKDRTQAIFINWNVIEYLRKVLRDDDETLDTIWDAWNITSPKEDKVKEGRWEIEQGYDEESLIQVNKAGFEILDRIFGNYPAYLLCLLDWLDKDDLPSVITNIPKYQGYRGAEKDDPFYKAQKYFPRNSDMRSLMELSMIKGVDAIIPLKTSSIPPSEKNFFIKEAYACHASSEEPPWKNPPPWERIPDKRFPRPPIGPPEEPPELPEIPIVEPSPQGTGLTVYGDGKCNINTARIPVLMALGFQAETTRRIIAYRLYKGVFKRIDADYIIKELIAKGVLRPREPAFPSIVSNIQEVVAKGKLKVNSEYFRFLMNSLTVNGASHKAMVVLKREIKDIDGKKEKKVKIVTWWDDFL